MKKLKALKRDRVNRALESIFDYPLTIIEAPIGYGKTTAVREFLALKDIPVVWTSFLSEDESAASFWDRLAAEASKFDQAAGSTYSPSMNDPAAISSAAATMGRVMRKADTPHDISTIVSFWLVMVARARMEETSTAIGVM